MHTSHALSSEERARYLATAIQAAEAAGTVLLDHARSGFRIDHKAAINLVTDADRQAEETIVRTILSAHPTHRILAEERGRDGAMESPYQWIIDPLDGTTNFAHGFPFYSVSIGLEYHGECIVGVVLDPTRRELFTAVVGEGAYLNGERLRVSANESLDHSLLVTGFAYDIRDTTNNNLDHFSRISLRAQGVRRTGSAALDLCYVASGRFDGYWEVKLSPWDMAAGIVMVREAGGLISSFQKDTFSLYGQELVATNGHIHNQLLDVIHQRPDRS
ncbi:MAG: Inositol-1-monophosphatase [Nitrospira sp.]|nr:MAG: Inositol-1-monophosphatase [Nitrospira sp.]